MQFHATSGKANASKAEGVEIPRHSIQIKSYCLSITVAYQKLSCYIRNANMQISLVRTFEFNNELRTRSGKTAVKRWMITAA